LIWQLRSQDLVTRVLPMEFVFSVGETVEFSIRVLSD